MKTIIAVNKYEKLLLEINYIINDHSHTRRSDQVPSEQITIDIIEKIKITLNDKKFNKNLEQAISVQPSFLYYSYINSDEGKLPEHLHNAMISHGIKNPTDPYVRTYFDNLEDWSATE